MTFTSEYHIIANMQYKHLGKYIRNKRIKAGHTLNKFAFEIAMEPATLSRIENLKLAVKIDSLIKIASGFKLSPAEFLTEFEQK